MVREDLTWWDSARLNETLQRQLLKQFLIINGLRGAVPRLVWGGEEPAAARATADMLDALARAGLEPTDDAFPALSDRIGFPLQRKRLAPVMPPPPLGEGLRALAAGVGDRARATDPTAELVSARKAALAKLYRGRWEAIVDVVSQSTDPDDCLRKLSELLPDLPRAQLAEEIETALQIAAAAGAARAVEKPRHA